MSHTPTPWHTGGTGNLIVFAGDGYAVANATVFHGKQEDGESAANAALIVRAVNAHDKLVAAVRAYLSAQGDCDCDTCELARAALAAAEGKG